MALKATTAAAGVVAMSIVPAVNVFEPATAVAVKTARTPLVAAAPTTDSTPTPATSAAGGRRVDRKEERAGRMPSHTVIDSTLRWHGQRTLDLASRRRRPRRRDPPDG